MGYASAFAIPMPASRQLGKRIHDLILLCSLPERVRELYGLRCTALQEAACARAACNLPPRPAAAATQAGARLVRPGVSGRRRD